MVSILHVNNNRKDPQERSDYKITKQRKTKTNTTFREPGRSLGAITSREVDCENNILEPSQVPAVKLEEDDKSSSLASRVMSRPLLDIIVMSGKFIKDGSVSVLRGRSTLKSFSVFPHSGAKLKSFWLTGAQ